MESANNKINACKDTFKCHCSCYCGLGFKSWNLPTQSRVKNFMADFTKVCLVYFQVMPDLSGRIEASLGEGLKTNAVKVLLKRSNPSLNIYVSNFKTKVCSEPEGNQSHYNPLPHRDAF